MLKSSMFAIVISFSTLIPSSAYAYKSCALSNAAAACADLGGVDYINWAIGCHGRVTCCNGATLPYGDNQFVGRIEKEALSSGVLTITTPFLELNILIEKKEESEESGFKEE